MRKQHWLLLAASMAVVMVSDHLLKRWALGLSGIQMLGPFGLTLVYNPGAMLGLFSDMPPVLRVVALSTGGGFLLVTFAIVQYLLPIQSFLLRLGSGVLLAGILGNVLDRTLWGHVVDFIFVEVAGKKTAVFNPADAYQWVGYLMLAVALIRDGDKIWPENNVRGRYWINPGFQLRYCLKLVTIGLLFSAISGIFMFSYLRVTLLELSMGIPFEIMFHRFLYPFLIIHGVISVAFVAILFWFGKQASHRIAGPVYAFQRFVHLLSSGRHRSLRLRQADEFQELHDTAREIELILGVQQGLFGDKSMAPVTEITSGDDHIADIPRAS